MSFFFLMIRRPPRSTLSLHDALPISRLMRNGFVLMRIERLARRIDLLEPVARQRRSEEHTSELQSQSNLVCRLLLEKKDRLGSIAESRPALTTRRGPDPIPRYKVGAG